MSDFAGTDTGSSVSDAELVSMAAEIMGGGSKTAAPERPTKAVAEALAADAAGDEEETQEEAPERPAKAAKLAPEGEPDVDPAAIIRARMEKARAAKAAKAESRRQAEMSARLREYEEMQRRTVDERPSFDVDGFKSKLKSSPLTALQELGINLDEFTQAALEEGTPQSKMMAEMRAMKEQLDALHKQRQELEEREKKTAEVRERQRQEQEFCAMITQDEYPSLYEWFEDDPPALVREAYRTVEEFLGKGGDPEDISDDDVAWFLEQKYSKKLGKFKGKAAARLGTQPAPSTSKPRTPSQAKASETGKLGGKDFASMSDEEQLAMLIEVARNEMSKNAN